MIFGRNKEERRKACVPRRVFAWFPLQLNDGRHIWWQDVIEIPDSWTKDYVVMEYIYCLPGDKFAEIAVNKLPPKGGVDEGHSLWLLGL